MNAPDTVPISPEQARQARIDAAAAIETARAQLITAAGRFDIAGDNRVVHYLRLAITSLDDARSTMALQERARQMDARTDDEWERHERGE